MYITRAEGVVPDAGKPRRFRRQESGDNCFEETVVSLLTDAIEFINQNGDHQPRRDELSKPDQQQDAEEQDESARTSDENPELKSGLDVSA